MRRGLVRFLPGWFFNREVKATREGYIFIGLILTVGIAAFNTGNNLLYLIMAMLFSTLLASFTLSEYSIAEIRLERKLPHHVNAGVQFAATYHLTNLKRILPSVNLLVEDHIEDQSIRVLFGMVAGRTTLRSALRLWPIAQDRLPGNATEEVTIPATLNRRGRLKWNRVTVSTLYPFGFFTKSKQVELPGQIVVYPWMEQIQDQPRSPHTPLGQVRRYVRGPGQELFGFREYRRGDNIRLVHWKTSARTGRLMVRQFERELERSVRLEIDLSSVRPSTDDPARERSVSRAAGLASHYIHKGYRVRLEIRERGLDYGTGLDHLQRILHFLALFDDPLEPVMGRALRPEHLSTGQSRISIS